MTYKCGDILFYLFRPRCFLYKGRRLLIHSQRLRFQKTYGKENKQIYDGTSGPFTYGDICAKRMHRSPPTAGQKHRTRIQCAKNIVLDILRSTVQLYH